MNNDDVFLVYQNLTDEQWDEQLVKGIEDCEQQSQKNKGYQPPDFLLNDPLSRFMGSAKEQQERVDEQRALKSLDALKQYHDLFNIEDELRGVEEPVVYDVKDNAIESTHGAGSGADSESEESGTERHDSDINNSTAGTDDASSKNQIFSVYDVQAPHFSETISYDDFPKLPSNMYLSDAWVFHARNIAAKKRKLIASATFNSKGALRPRATGHGATLTIEGSDGIPRYLVVFGNVQLLGEGGTKRRDFPGTKAGGSSLGNSWKTGNVVNPSDTIPRTTTAPTLASHTNDFTSINRPTKRSVSASTEGSKFLAKSTLKKMKVMRDADRAAAAAEDERRWEKVKAVKAEYKHSSGRSLGSSDGSKRSNRERVLPPVKPFTSGYQVSDDYASGFSQRSSTLPRVVKPTPRTQHVVEPTPRTQPQRPIEPAKVDDNDFLPDIILQPPKMPDLSKSERVFLESSRWYAKAHHNDLNMIRQVGQNLVNMNSSEGMKTSIKQLLDHYTSAKVELLKRRKVEKEAGCFEAVWGEEPLVDTLVKMNGGRLRGHLGTD